MRHAVTLTCALSPVLVVALVFAGLAAALAIAVDLVDDGSTRPSPVGLAAPWADQLVALEEALAANDAKAASWAFQQAHRLALGSRRWEGMADVGDASLRIGNPVKARIAYLTAAVRARTARSSVGALRAAEGFAGLGDHEAANRWIAVARDLAGPDPMAIRRVHAVADRMAVRGSAEILP
jgi:hypothetical protein